MDDLRRKVHTLTVELADVRAQSATMSELNAEMKQLKETIVGFTSSRAAEKARSRGPSTPLSAHLNKKVSGSG